MDYPACLRCGSLDLAVPGIRDGIFPEGGELLSSACRTCGYQGAPVVFADRDAWLQFREERQALYRPGPEAPQLPPGIEERARPRSRWMGGIAALVGFAFLSAAVLAFLTAAQLGGDAWFTVAPSGVVALLLGLPFAAMAARRRG